MDFKIMKSINHKGFSMYGSRAFLTDFQ
jgi:hypothetical protein